jgi:hypothetical protein
MSINVIGINPHFLTWRTFMNKKILVVAIAVATAAASSSAFAVAKFGNSNQTGSLLIFPRIQADTQNSAVNNPVAPGFNTVTVQTDTLVDITNTSTTPIKLSCYWNTTTQILTGMGGNTSVAPSEKAAALNARIALRDQHAYPFELQVPARQSIAFWAGDLSSLSNVASHFLDDDNFSSLSTTANPPQFNFFPDGAQSNAGELRCWAVTGAGLEAQYNHLIGKATIFSFPNAKIVAAGGLPESAAAAPYQAHEYSAWAFQRLTKSDSADGLKLDGKEYDQCPSALTGSIIPAAHPAISTVNFKALSNGTQVSLSSCNQHLDGDANVSLINYTVVDNAGNKRAGGKECMGAWYEADLGTKFHAFTWAALKSDTASFRIESLPPNKVCNQEAATKPEADIVSSGLVGIQVNDVSGYYQSSSSLTGVSVENAAVGDYYNKTPILNTITY